MVSVPFHASSTARLTFSQTFSIYPLICPWMRRCLRINLPLHWQVHSYLIALLIIYAFAYGTYLSDYLYANVSCFSLRFSSSPSSLPTPSSLLCTHICMYFLCFTSFCSPDRSGCSFAHLFVHFSMHSTILSVCLE